MLRAYGCRNIAGEESASISMQGQVGSPIHERVSLFPVGVLGGSFIAQLAVCEKHVPAARGLEAAYYVFTRRPARPCLL